MCAHLCIVVATKDVRCGEIRSESTPGGVRAHSVCAVWKLTGQPLFIRARCPYHTYELLIYWSRSRGKTRKPYTYPESDTVIINKLFRSWVRRWYIAAGFAIVTLGAVIVSLQVEGVYSTKVDVVFLAPTALLGNSLSETSDSLINFAAIVEREYNGNVSQARFSNPDATLYGAGVRDGHAVTLLDSGGQWKDSFTRPVLTAEVVGASESDVRATLQEVLDDINLVAAAQQDRASVDPAERITTLASPQVAVVTYADGSRTRAVAAIVLLGLGIGGVATALFDRLLSRGTPRRG